MKNNLAGLSSSPTITFTSPSSPGTAGTTFGSPSSNPLFGTPSFKSPSVNPSFEYSSATGKFANTSAASTTGLTGPAIGKSSFGVSGLESTIGLPSLSIGANNTFGAGGIGTNSNSTSYGIGMSAGGAYGGSGSIGLSSGIGSTLGSVGGMSKGLSTFNNLPSSNFPALNLTPEPFKAPSTGLAGMALPTTSLGTTDFSKFGISNPSFSYSSTYADSSKPTFPTSTFGNPGIRPFEQSPFGITDFTRPRSQERPTSEGLFTDMAALTAGLSRERSQSQDKGVNSFKFGGSSNQTTTLNNVTITTNAAPAIRKN